MSGLKAPPASLANFPEIPPSEQSTVLYRIFWHLDESGAENSPWRFSSLPSDNNRFDLPDPEGTCYWSDEPYGAFVEVFRGATLIDPADVAKRRLFVATPPTLRIADLTSLSSYAFGITAEISTIDDYDLPQEWAAALRAAGLEALWGTCRHDPSSDAHNVAVFGPAGVQSTRAGWTYRDQELENHAELLESLKLLGVQIEPIPVTVSTVSPPPV